MMCSLSVSFLIGVYAVSALGLPVTPSSSFAVHGIVTRHRHGTWTRHELRHTTMKLRGGSETEAAVTDETKDAPVGFAAQLYSALKENKSLDPNDHPTSLQWALAVLLAIYTAIGAPLAKYIPALRELTYVAPKEVPLTQAQIERMEREALRKEQEEEYAKTLMEDSLTQAAEDAKKEKIDAARRAQEEAENAAKSAMSQYTAHITAAEARLPAEPAEGVLLRLRCPDGHQLTRKFAKDSKMLSLYDYVDIERHKKASKALDVEDKLLELAKFEYNLVCTMPKLLLSDKSVTLEEAGIKASCALMVQPVLKQ